MSKKELRQRRRAYTRQFYRNNHLALLGVLCFVTLMCLVQLSVSWLLQIVTDLIGGGSRYTLLQTLGFTLVCVSVMALSYAIAHAAIPRFLTRASAQYKEFVFEKLSRKGISAFSGENTSFYISALNNDVNTIETDYLGNLFDLISQCVLFVGSLGLMLYYSPLLTAIAVALTLLPILASMLAGNRVAAATGQVSEAKASYTATLSDCLSGFSVVKSFKAEMAICRQFSQQVQAVRQADTRRRKAMILVQALGGIASLIAQFGVFLAGAALALSGHLISGGTLIAFVNLMNGVVNPISTVPQYLAQRKAALGLIDKLADALEENIRQEGLAEKSELTQGIVLEDLRFGYEPGKPVLEQLSLTFEKGKSYAIVGGSGSGKSTLLNLLMAAYPGYEGTIRYDETELRQLGTESLYEMVALVQQNVFIFNASIRDNITMFSPFPKAEVDAAIRLSGLEGLIAQRGEDYLCGENGSGLSGGEKQRISIARSLLKKSQVLLVDEATAALDAQTAWQVSDAILNLRDMTRIVVTHALDEGLLCRYDCILALKNGRIAEEGTFSDLMAQKGYFYSLFTVSQ